MAKDGSGAEIAKNIGQMSDLSKAESGTLGREVPTGVPEGQTPGTPWQQRVAQGAKITDVGGSYDANRSMYDENGNVKPEFRNKVFKRTKSLSDIVKGNKP